MTRPCRACGQLVSPTPTQVRRGDYICKPCNAKRALGWTNTRRANGLPLRDQHNYLSWRKQYDEEYQAIPEVKKRRAADMRRYAHDPQLRPHHKSRWLLNRAIAAGRIQRQPCQECGNPKTDGHHEDYLKPYDVTWLCRACHRLKHAALREGR